MMKITAVLFALLAFTADAYAPRTYYYGFCLLSWAFLGLFSHKIVDVLVSR